jgi:hypothetical protein
MSERQRIVADFNYHDADGKLLFQAIRLEPGKDGAKKEFRQRQPDGNGGWVWNLKGVNLVPYRLPELLAANPEIPVYIAEGERKVDVLIGMGMVATCSAMGANKWRKEYSQHLAARHVVILPDNDDPGRKHAEDVAEKLREIAASVTIFNLPDLPPKGDIVDWAGLPGNTKVRLLELLAAATGGKGDAFEDERDRAQAGTFLAPQYQPFPVELLPEPIASFVRQLAVALGCDASYPALPALAVAASAIGNTRTLMLKRGWREPAVIWAATVGDSGTLKSPALAPVIEPLFKHQRENQEAYRSKVQVYEQRMAQHRATAKAAKQGGGEPEPLPEAPTLEKVVCGDVTVEKLAEILEDNPRGILVQRDELAGWFGSFTRYKSSGGTDLPHWLEMFRAGSVIVDRKGGDRKNIYIDRAAVSVCGTIQPGTLSRAMTPECLEMGLGARVLMAMPPKTVKRWTEVEVHPDTEAEYCRTIDKLLALDFNRDTSGFKPRPHELRLSADAKDAFIKFYNDWAQRQAAAGRYMSAVLSKLEGYAARLALVHHVVTCAGADKDDLEALGETSMAAGIGLAKWFAGEAERLEALLGDGEQERERRKLAEYIRERGGKITARDLNKNNRQFQTTEAAESGLDDLVRAGFGHWQDSPAGPRGGRPTRVFCLGGVGETYPRIAT